MPGPPNDIVHLRKHTIAVATTQYTAYVNEKSTYRQNLLLQQERQVKQHKLVQQKKMNQKEINLTTVIIITIKARHVFDEILCINTSAHKKKTQC